MFSEFPASLIDEIVAVQSSSNEHVHLVRVYTLYGHRKNRKRTNSQ